VGGLSELHGAHHIELYGWDRTSPRFFVEKRRSDGASAIVGWARLDERIHTTKPGGVFRSEFSGSPEIANRIHPPSSVAMASRTDRPESAVTVASRDHPRGVARRAARVRPVGGERALLPRSRRHKAFRKRPNPLARNSSSEMLPILRRLETLLHSPRRLAGWMRLRALPASDDSGLSQRPTTQRGER
jgi:hypothetical protein